MENSNSRRDNKLQELDLSLDFYKPFNNNFCEKTHKNNKLIKSKSVNTAILSKITKFKLHVYFHAVVGYTGPGKERFCGYDHFE